MDVILSFSRDRERNWVGRWISIWAMNELKEVTFEEGNLSFVHTARWRDNEYTSTFEGAIEAGRLTGTLSSDRGESNIEGQRRPRVPRAVGNWEMKFKVRDRDITTTLVITTDKEGQLAGEWQS
jgi:hypothetical protein